MSQVLRRHQLPYLHELDPITGQQTAPPKPKRLGVSTTLDQQPSPDAKPLPPGSSTTTMNADTPHSEANPQPAVCHPPDGRVHLDRVWPGIDPDYIVEVANCPEAASLEEYAVRTLLSA